MSEDAPAAATSFTVELPVFTGPFRLLAEMILDQKLDVCDVPVARVTDGFLSYAKDADNWSLEEATWFLATCAILLELKIGRLMPRRRVGCLKLDRLALPTESRHRGQPPRLGEAVQPGDLDPQRDPFLQPDVPREIQ